MKRPAIERPRRHGSALLVALVMVVVGAIVPNLDPAGLREGLAAETDRAVAGWTLYTPGEIRWTDAPPSLPPGAKMALLEGDPSKEGFFTMRLLLPDGYRVAPHWHPKAERLTIISGTVNLGTGDRFDPTATRALPAGTYSSMPAKMTHFAWMTGETVLQLSSIGPWDVVYVDPADDPRKK